MTDAQRFEVYWRGYDEAMRNAIINLDDEGMSDAAAMLRQRVAAGQAARRAAARARRVVDDRARGGAVIDLGAIRKHASNVDFVRGDDGGSYTSASWTDVSIDALNGACSEIEWLGTKLEASERDRAALVARVEGLRKALGDTREGLSSLLGTQHVLKHAAKLIVDWKDDPAWLKAENRIDSIDRVVATCAEWHRAVVAMGHAVRAALGEAP